jgi:Domain of unknown function (DUF4157)
VSFERERDQVHRAPATPTYDDVSPGRTSLSGQLIGPTHPLTSGLIQRKARDANGVAEGAEAAVASSANSTGQGLPGPLKQQFESSLGTDLSSVRIHTGSESATAARAVGAKAYTVGQDIHFGAGQFAPTDPSGIHLLAHEVAHTVQQGGGTPTPQYKLEVSSPGDAAEVEADRVADAMMTGAPATIGQAAPQVAREAAPGAAAAPAADKPASPVWVEFDHDGNWKAAEVLATLGSQAAVPEDLKAAIMAGPKATASYCATLRARVAAGELDEAKKAQIGSALTSRITELALATPQSPLQYSQLADVARWADQYKAAGAPAAAPSPGAAPTSAGQPGASAGKGDQAAETFATKLAQASARDTAKGDTRLKTSSDPKPGVTSKANDEHGGEESGNAELTGWRFVHDPFDNTVTAVRPDGTEDNAGLLFTFQVAGGAATLVGRPQVLSKFRVAILKRQDAIKGTEPQEKDKEGRADPTKAAARIAQDKEWTAADRKYDADHAAWEKGGKVGTEPPRPKNYLPVEHRTTLCNSYPGTVYQDAGGGKNDGFSFDPKTQQKATPPPIWKTFDSAPEGPKPGDVCYLLFLGGATSHMGIFKSKAPIPGKADEEMWVMTDGGQGGYEQAQLAQERTRRFEKSTKIFRDSAEGGQTTGDRRLAGWIDLDEYRQLQQAKHPQPTSV